MPNASYVLSGYYDMLHVPLASRYKSIALVGCSTVPLYLMHSELTNHTKNMYHELGQWNLEEIWDEILCNTNAPHEEVNPEWPGHIHVSSSPKVSHSPYFYLLI